MIVVLAIAGGMYVWTPRGSQPGSAAALATTAPSIQDLQITQLTTSGNADRPAMSPDGKYVAYIQHDGNNDSLWVRQTTTPSNVQIVPAEPGVALLGATVTPDGGYVDFVRSQRTLTVELWRVAFLGGTPKRIVDNLGSLVAWSPDGRRMAFVRDLSKSGTSPIPESTALITADPDGSHEKVLAVRRRPFFFNITPIYSSIQQPGWSPEWRHDRAASKRRCRPDARAEGSTWSPLTSRRARSGSFQSMECRRSHGSMMLRSCSVGGRTERGVAVVAAVVSRGDAVAPDERSEQLRGGERHRRSPQPGDGTTRHAHRHLGRRSSGDTRRRSSCRWRLEKGETSPGRAIASFTPASPRANHRSSASRRTAGMREEIVLKGIGPGATSDGRTIVYVSTETGSECRSVEGRRRRPQRHSARVWCDHGRPGNHRELGHRDPRRPSGGLRLSRRVGCQPYGPCRSMAERRLDCSKASRSPRTCRRTARCSCMARPMRRIDQCRGVRLPVLHRPSIV